MVHAIITTTPPCMNWMFVVIVVADLQTHARWIFGWVIIIFTIGQNLVGNKNSPNLILKPSIFRSAAIASASVITNNSSAWCWWWLIYCPQRTEWTYNSGKKQIVSRLGDIQMEMDKSSAFNGISMLTRVHCQEVSATRVTKW